MSPENALLRHGPVHVHVDVHAVLRQHLVVGDPSPLKRSSVSGSKQQPAWRLPRTCRSPWFRIRSLVVKYKDPFSHSSPSQSWRRGRLAGSRFRGLVCSSAGSRWEFAHMVAF